MILLSKLLISINFSKDLEKELILQIAPKTSSRKGKITPKKELTAHCLRKTGLECHVLFEWPLQCNYIMVLVLHVVLGIPKLSLPVINAYLK